MNNNKNIVLQWKKNGMTFRKIISREKPLEVFNELIVYKPNNTTLEELLKSFLKYDNFYIDWDFHDYVTVMYYKTRSKRDFLPLFKYEDKLILKELKQFCKGNYDNGEVELLQYSFIDF